KAGIILSAQTRYPLPALRWHPCILKPELFTVPRALTSYQFSGSIDSLLQGFMVKIRTYHQQVVFSGRNFCARRGLGQCLACLTLIKTTKRRVLVCIVPQLFSQQIPVQRLLVIQRVLTTDNRAPTFYSFFLALLKS